MNKITAPPPQGAPESPALARIIRPPEETLTLIIGDWNFVRVDNDRTQLTEQAWGRANEESLEHREWVAELLGPGGFYESRQEEVTHRTSLGASRLDRVYVNPPLASQLYTGWACTALPWETGLSTHRPLQVMRTTGGAAGTSKALPLAPTRTKEWAVGVRLRWTEKQKNDSHEDCPHRRLLLLKKAMSEVTIDMQNAEKSAKRASLRTGSLPPFAA